MLNDTDVLADKKVVDKATIFLVKGTCEQPKTGSSSSSSATPGDADKKKEEDDKPEESRPCVGGCGFFVS